MGSTQKDPNTQLWDFYLKKSGLEWGVADIVDSFRNPQTDFQRLNRWLIMQIFVFDSFFDFKGISQDDGSNAKIVKLASVSKTLKKTQVNQYLNFLIRKNLIPEEWFPSTAAKELREEMFNHFSSIVLKAANIQITDEATKQINAFSFQKDSVVNFEQLWNGKDDARGKKQVFIDDYAVIEGQRAPISQVLCIGKITQLCRQIEKIWMNQKTHSLLQEWITVCVLQPIDRFIHDVLGLDLKSKKAATVRNLMFALVSSNQGFLYPNEQLKNMFVPFVYTISSAHPVASLSEKKIVFSYASSLFCGIELEYTSLWANGLIDFSLDEIDEDGKLDIKTFDTILPFSRWLRSSRTDIQNVDLPVKGEGNENTFLRKKLGELFENRSKPKESTIQLWNQNHKTFRQFFQRPSEHLLQKIEKNSISDEMWRISSFDFHTLTSMFYGMFAFYDSNSNFRNDFLKNLDSTVSKDKMKKIRSFTSLKSWKKTFHDSMETWKQQDISNTTLIVNDETLSFHAEDLENKRRKVTYTDIDFDIVQNIIPDPKRRQLCRLLLKEYAKKTSVDKLLWWKDMLNPSNSNTPSLTSSFDWFSKTPMTVLQASSENTSNDVSLQANMSQNRFNLHNLGVHSVVYGTNDDDWSDTNPPIPTPKNALSRVSLQQTIASDDSLPIPLDGAELCAHATQLSQYIGENIDYFTSTSVFNGIKKLSFQTLSCEAILMRVNTNNNERNYCVVLKPTSTLDISPLALDSLRSVPDGIYTKSIGIKNRVKTRITHPVAYIHLAYRLYIWLSRNVAIDQLYISGYREYGTYAAFVGYYVRQFMNSETAVPDIFKIKSLQIHTFSAPDPFFKPFSSQHRDEADAEMEKIKSIYGESRPHSWWPFEYVNLFGEKGKLSGEIHENNNNKENIKFKMIKARQWNSDVAQNIEAINLNRNGVNRVFYFSKTHRMVEALKFRDNEGKLFTFEYLAEKS